MGARPVSTGYSWIHMFKETSTCRQYCSCCSHLWTQSTRNGDGTLTVLTMLLLPDRCMPCNACKRRQPLYLLHMFQTVLNSASFKMSTMIIWCICVPYIYLVAWDTLMNANCDHTHVTAIAFMQPYFGTNDCWGPVWIQVSLQMKLLLIYPFLSCVLSILYPLPCLWHTSRGLSPAHWCAMLSHHRDESHGLSSHHVGSWCKPCRNW